MNTPVLHEDIQAIMLQLLWLVWIPLISVSHWKITLAALMDDQDADVRNALTLCYQVSKNTR